MSASASPSQRRGRGKEALAAASQAAAAGTFSLGKKEASALRSEVAALTTRVLAEDGSCDVTSAALIESSRQGRTALVARSPLTVAGMEAASALLKVCDPSCRLRPLLKDGCDAPAGAVLAVAEGNLRALLRAERPLLNLFQLLCAVATTSRRLCRLLAGTGATLLDTRKTVPGLRRLAKYAAAVGGAAHHRYGLDDGVLVKDNHIAAAGGMEAALMNLRAAGVRRFIVECDALPQVKTALDYEAPWLLLDNMSLSDVRRAVALACRRSTLEASGGIDERNVRAYGETGVAYVSVGSMTLFPDAVDIGLDWRATEEPWGGGFKKTPPPAS